MMWQRSWRAVWVFFNPYLSQTEQFGERLDRVENRLTTVEQSVEAIAERMGHE